MMPKNLSCIQETDELYEKDKTYECSIDYAKFKNQEQLYEFMRQKKLLNVDPNCPMEQVSFSIDQKQSPLNDSQQRMTLQLDRFTTTGGNGGPMNLQNSNFIDDSKIIEMLQSDQEGFF